MENVDIFIYSHIPFKPLVKNNVYKILTHTDKEIPDTDLTVYRDYVGNNIAEKNLMYNEYTGLYWIWKNYDIKDYVGLIHYRRWYSFLDDVPNFDQIFKTFDIVLSEPLYLNLDRCSLKGYPTMNNREWYAFFHNVEDFDLLEKMIYEKYPEYINGFEKMKNSNYIYNSNMFIMKRNDYIKYCEFIFKALNDYMDMIGIHTVEESIKYVEDNIEKYHKPLLPYYTVNIQARIIGYIAERLLNTYLLNGDVSLVDRSIYLPWGQSNDNY